MTRRRLLSVVIVTLSLALTGCSTWSTASVEPNRNYSTGSSVPTDLNKIIITEEDINDRKYKVLGDLSVSVNKTTIFHSDPTKEQVSEKLKQEASKLGADAVILVRYGTVGVSFSSWGSMDGKGRAIKFVE